MIPVLPEHDLSDRTVHAAINPLLTEIVFPDMRVLA
jgi:hypothetical protein